MARSTRALLLELEDHARDVQEFLAGCERARFVAEKMRYRAVCDGLHAIAAALREMDPVARDRLRQRGLPLDELMDVRGLLIHEDWTTSAGLLWSLASRVAEPLIAAASVEARRLGAVPADAGDDEAEEEDGEAPSA